MLHWKKSPESGSANQRETTAIWDKAIGEPLEEAIVWCGRASGIGAEDCGAGARRGDPRGDGFGSWLIFSCCKDGVVAETAEKKERNVLQTGKFLSTIDTAGWFTS